MGKAFVVIGASCSAHALLRYMIHTTVLGRVERFRVPRHTTI